MAPRVNRNKRNINTGDNTEYIKAPVMKIEYDHLVTSFTSMFYGTHIFVHQVGNKSLISLFLSLTNVRFLYDSARLNIIFL